MQAADQRKKFCSHVLDQRSPEAAVFALVREDAPSRAARIRRSHMKRIWIRPLLFITLLLIIWHFAAGLQDVKLLPTPMKVASGIAELARRGLLLKYIVASLF